MRQLSAVVCGVCPQAIVETTFPLLLHIFQTLLNAPSQDAQVGTARHTPRRSLLSRAACLSLRLPSLPPCAALPLHTLCASARRGVVMVVCIKVFAWRE